MKFKSLLVGIVLSIGIFTPVLSEPVGAVSELAEQRICEDTGGVYSGGDCRTPGQTQTVEGTYLNIINVILGIIGVVAVIMIIIGGLRFVLSGGDQSAVKSAKNTIAYSVIGVIVAFSAYAIINFVVESII